MKPPAKQPKPASGRIRLLLWKAVPFSTLILIIFLIGFPLYHKIIDKKNALADIQSRDTSAKKPLTNVITLIMKPSYLAEAISLPGIVQPWISLQVVAEIQGKITDKRIREGQRVKTGDVLAVIDTSDYQNAYNAALAAYETTLTTETRLGSLMKNSFATQSQMDDAVARRKSAQAELENARLSLSRCTILSPMEGVVDRSFIETGTFLSPGDPVALILQIDRVKVTVGIPESDVDAVRKLRTFEMTIDALGGKALTGSYHYLHKTTDSLARLYNLEIRVDNPDWEILPDMFARVTIVKNENHQGLAVPIYSLLTVNKRTGVYVEKDGMVHFRPVQTGFLDGWRTEVSEGLEPGDRVVVVGHRIIEDGELVHVTKTIQDMEEISP